MTMDQVPATKPPGAKDSAYWNWYMWIFQEFNTFPLAYYLDYPITPPIRFTNIASRGDNTAILIKYDETDM